VAGEVRALAQRVTSAASEVRTLISESVEPVDDGSRKVKVMGVTMQQLVDCSGQVKSLVDEIAVASTTQQLRISEVSRTRQHRRPCC
jgi:methyl-accepting chemotaxis protein